MTSDTGYADPLLTTVSAEQITLLRIVGEVLAESGRWPVFQYVEARLDDAGFDADAVLRSMPSIVHGHLNYSLVRRGHSTSPETPVKLTVAGLAHLPEHAELVGMFLAVLNELATRRADAAYDPHRVIEVTVSGGELLRELGLDTHPLAGILPDLIGGEPATWHGGGNLDSGDWTPRASSFVRRFRAVDGVDDYLRRLRAFILPAAPAAAPVVVSPLNLVTALDYLNVVWQLRFRANLLIIPSVERSARLAFDATTAEEFDNRLSALGEMFKGFDPPGNDHQGSLHRLRVFLRDHLPAESVARVEPALATLRSATHIRNAGQHFDAATDAAMALPELGLTYPIIDFTHAWRTVQVHVTQALDTIRQEIQATLPSPGRRSAPRRGRADTTSGRRV
ncbi:hypothetical protein GCM10020358_05910 [Amorphoplanes nipponensis]|uniref:Uncharacterized protein n=1 Tax=Actinoplanes nipponensis TaxID=135950 RepID=A0A919JIS6_9ACTN|nr:hypothetical protein [Actinoplanes nipponensis]GIE50222.1 hypothetical protein Ani05nite_37560 [Actinoplanes nipponensis]